MATLKAALLKLRRDSVPPSALTGSISLGTLLDSGEAYMYSGNETLNIGTDGLGGYITLVNLDVMNSGSIKASGDIYGTHGIFTGNIDVTGDITIGGNIILGDAIVDQIAVNASLSGSLIPSIGSAFDLGSPSNHYRTLYVDTANITDVTASYVEYVDVGHKPTLVSGSSQIDHNVISNYTASRHIDHINLAVNAGSGLTGGGILTSSQTLTLDTGSVHFNSGIKTKLNVENVFSSSAQIDVNNTQNFTPFSSSVDLRIDLLEIDSASLDNRYEEIASSTHTLVSGSIQIDHDLTLNYNPLEHFTSASLFISESQIVDLAHTDITSLNAYTSSNDIVIQGLNTFTSSIQTEVDGLSAATSSYLLNTSDTLDGNLIVTGNITAQEFHTEYISASVIYESGSTKFGDTSDDIHDFTGSINVLGEVSASTYRGDGSNLTGLPAGYTDADVKAKLDVENVFSSSAQIDHDTTTNYNNLEHFTSASITITESQISDLVHYTDTDVKAKLDVENVFSSSAQIDHDLTTNYNPLEHFTSASITITESQISDLAHTDITSLNAYTSSNDIVIQGLNTFTSSIQTEVDGLSAATSSYLLNTTDTLDGNLTITHNLFIGSGSTSYNENIDVDLVTPEVVATFPIATYTAGFFDYSVKNGTNVRAGTVIITHNGINTVHTDNSTTDLGDTSGVVFTSDILTGNVRLIATVTTDNWIIKTLVRTI